MIMSFVCVSQFIFVANDKPATTKQITNTSITLIETISSCTKEDWAALGGEGL